MSYAKCAKEISKLCGVPGKTLEARINGRYKIASKKELEAWMKVLDLDADTLLKIFPDINVTVNDAPNNSKKSFNTELVNKKLEEAGFTKKKIQSILGITDTTYRCWEKGKYAPKEEIAKRLASLLDVKTSDIYIKKEIDTTPTPKKIKTAQGAVVPVVPSEFLKIDTTNIHDIFNIINNNILLLAQNMDKFTRLQETKNNELTDAINSLGAILGGIQDAVIPVPHEETLPCDNYEETKLAVKKDSADDEKERLRNLIDEYGENDSLASYKFKINSMVSYIARKRNNTHKQTLHTLYETMTNVYGIVYAQLQKEFRESEHRKENGTIELIYYNPLYREIFYHEVASNLGTLLVA